MLNIVDVSKLCQFSLISTKNYTIYEIDDD